MRRSGMRSFLVTLNASSLLFAGLAMSCHRVRQ
jgi:hypothetical protein